MRYRYIINEMISQNLYYVFRKYINTWQVLNFFPPCLICTTRMSCVTPTFFALFVISRYWTIQLHDREFNGNVNRQIRLTINEICRQQDSRWTSHIRTFFYGVPLQTQAIVCDLSRSKWNSHHQIPLTLEATVFECSNNRIILNYDWRLSNYILLQRRVIRYI